MSLLDDASLIITPNAVKAGKLYSVVPNTDLGDMTVVRATTATRVNASGLIENVGLNVPRLDYTNTSCPSILVEPQRTNLVLQSEQIQSTSFGGAWIFAAINSSFLNVSTSPNGTFSADKITPQTTNGGHFIAQSITTNKTVTQTATCFFKSSEYTRCGVRFNDNNISQGNIFDLLSGQVVASVGTKTTARIVNYGNGWYRCEVTINAPTDLLNVQFAIIDNNSVVFEFLGDINRGLLLWGAQLEVGSNATSYISTVATTVTRNADVISKAGISSLIGQTEGSIYLKFYRTTETTGFKNLFTLFDGINTSVNSIQFQSTNNNINLSVFIIVNSTTFTITGTSRTLLNGINKICLVYSQNGSKVFLNGILTGTISNVNLPLLNNLSLGHRTSDRQWGAIDDAILFKNQLTDQQAIQLTTL